MAEFVTLEDAQFQVRTVAGDPDELHLEATIEMAEALCLSYIGYAGGSPSTLSVGEVQQLRAGILALTAFLWRYRGDQDKLPIQNPDDLPPTVVMYLRRLRTPPIA